MDLMQFQRLFDKEPRYRLEQAKRAVYLFASTILGVLLSLVVHALIEIGYLRWAESQGRIVPFYGSCTLSPTLRIMLLALGAVGGFLLGRFWWRKVYFRSASTTGFSRG